MASIIRWIFFILFFAAMLGLAGIIDARANRTEAYAKKAASCVTILTGTPS